MTTERNFYERLLDGISDGLYFMDRERIIRYWNRGAERITGFSRDEVIGTACRDNVLMHVDDAGTSLCLAEFCPALQPLWTARNARLKSISITRKVIGYPSLPEYRPYGTTPEILRER